MGTHGRLLITGVSGFLGAHCAWGLRDAWDVTGTVHRSPIGIPNVATVPLDLADRQGVRALVESVAPDVILHTAAMTKPESCARLPQAATRINVGGTAALVDAARRVHARLVYISTDLVFSGAHGPYAESASPHPLNHYGRTKLQGEWLTRQLGARGTVLRSSILYGWPRGPHGCFLDWLIQALHGPETIGLFADQHWAFLFVDDAVEMIRRVLARPTAPPLLHLAGGEPANRCVFGEQFCEVFGYATTKIEAIRMRDAPAFEPRPANCALAGDLFTDRYDFRARTIWNGLLALSQHSRGWTFGPRPLRPD